jgi:polyferredoxin
LWTWGLQQNIVGDAFTALQLMLSGWSMQAAQLFFHGLRLPRFLAVGILIGKSLCGWVCPFGFIQDLVDFIKSKKREISPINP